MASMTSVKARLEDSLEVTVRERENHSPVYLSKGAGDTVLWTWNIPFKIAQITPDNPFDKALPFVATLTSNGSYEVDSGRIKPEAETTSADDSKKGHYDVTVVVGVPTGAAGTAADPHIIIGP